MTWEPPTHLEGEASAVSNYTIEWSLGPVDQTAIMVSHNHTYVFRNLQSGQLFSAAIRALPTKNTYGSPFSDVKQITLPEG